MSKSNDNGKTGGAERARESGSLFEGPGFPGPATASGFGPPVSAAGLGASSGGAASGVGMAGVVRDAVPAARAYGRGPAPVDSRKFRYDRIRGRTMGELPYGATKVDRLDAVAAGDLLDRLHKICGIDREPENVLMAFDKALFHEHTVNGASMLQPGRGFLSVAESLFELNAIKSVLGTEQRRFFRAYADEITEVNRETVDKFDPHDPVSAERYGQLMQVAVARGLQKYPYLAHDSSDAGVRLSIEERVALAGSKRLVLESTVNRADKTIERVAPGAGDD